MIVVTGATGNVGRTLVEALAAAGEPVAAVSRGTPAELPEGVRHHRGDLAEPESLAPALDGADALFLLVAGQDPQAIVDLAKAGGVRRIVLLSSQGAGTRPEVYRHPRVFEDAVRASGLQCTVLRPGGFHTNSLMWAETVRSQRFAAAPFGDVGLPGIDPTDIAEVAAVVLRDEGHDGQTYELTGPAVLTPRQQVAAIAGALGEPVRFVERSHAEARAYMLAQHMPEPVVDGTLAILGDPSADEQRVSPDVEKILGRATHTFTRWAARNIAAFR